LAFDQSGKRLIAVGANSVLTIDVATKKSTPLKADLQQGFVLCSALSSDAKLLALVQSKSGGRLLVINTEDGTTKLDEANAGTSPTDIDFSHDNKVVTITTHNQAWGMRSWSMETRKSLPPLQVGDNTSLSLAYSPDGKWLALGNGQTSVLLIDLATQTQKHSFGGFTGAVRWVEFTPDSKRLLAYDTSGQITVMDPQRQIELRKIESGPSQALPTISAEGTSVVSAAGHVVEAWNIETGEPLHPFEGHRSYIAQAAVSPDGRLGATVGQDHTLRIWDLESGNQLHMRRRKGYAAPTVAFTPDSRQLLWAGEPAVIEVLDLDTLTQNKPVAVAREIRGSQLAIFALSEDGRTLVANNSSAGGAQIWDFTKEKPNAALMRSPEGAQGNPLAFSPDARLCVTRFSVASSAQQLIIADIASSREITRLVTREHAVQQCVFAGSRLIATRAQRQIALWDVLSGKSVVNVGTAGAAAGTTAMTCSDDGRLLAWADNSSERTIRLYDSLHAREVNKFSGHTGAVRCLELHTSGNRPVLVSGSDDSTALVWDLRAVVDELRNSTPRLSTERPDQLWADLGAEDAAAVHRASWVLAAAGEEAVPLLAERLAPAPIDPSLGQKIARLVEQMDDDLFSVREQASQQAALLGEAAESHLDTALKTAKSAEVRHRIRRLLAEISARPLVLTAEQQRAIRAVHILEQIGSPQSRPVLERLAQGQPSDRLTQEAQSAVARMTGRERN
jgi:WD40 repeat protein